MLVSVIGPAALVSDLDVDVLPRRQERQVLAALAIDPRRTWRVDELAEALWPDGAVPTGAGKLVRNVVSRLRSTLGTGAIDSESDGYRIGSHVVIDVKLLFGNVDPLSELPSTHRGRPFCDVEDWPEAWAAIARVERRLVEVAEQRATALLGAGRWIEAIDQGEHLVEARPFSDQSWLLLTHANAGAGHRRDALEAIHRARRALGEAGLEPCNELRVLEAALLAGERTGPTTGTGHYRDGPATPPPSPFAMGVPDLGTRFVGRQDELNVVVEALANHPVVCLVGLGGIGKTRLAIEAARLVAAETGAGVAFVDLGSGTTDESVADVVARALGLPAASGAALEAWCITASALIVLDNADAVITEAAALADRLRRAGRGLRVLIISRSRHRAARLSSYQSVPWRSPRPSSCSSGGACSGIRCLLSRRCATPLTACRSQSRPSPPKLHTCIPMTYANGSTASCSSREADPTPPASSASSRTRSPHSSHGSCGPSAGRHSSRQPSTLTAFEAVTDPSEQDDPLDLLGGLVRHALLSVSSGAPTRYRLLDLVRAAADQPTDADRTRLVQWGVTVADSTGNGDGIALLADIPNLEAAAQTAWEAQDVPSALRLALLQFPLSIAGRTEGFTWAQRALALVGEFEDELAAMVGGQTGWNMVQYSLLGKAEEMCSRVLVDAPADCVGAGWAHLTLAVLRNDACDDRALGIALQHDDATLELGTRSMRAGMLAMTDPSNAQAHAEASRLRAARSEEPWHMVLAGYTNAVSLAPVDMAAACETMRNVRDLADRCGFYFQSAISRCVLVAWAPPSAPPPLEETVAALRAALEAGAHVVETLVLPPIAGALAAVDRVAEAAAVNDLLRRIDANQPVDHRIFAPEPDPAPNASTAGFHFPTVVSLLRHLSAS